MKKQEIHTSLNRQAQVLFGRTALELLLLACALAGGSCIWTAVTGSIPDPAGSILGSSLALVTILQATLLTVVPIAKRSPVEWAEIWIRYQIMPKVYISRRRSVL